ncbi:MAG: adenylate/guanylate cyclase domain-containing protein [Treponema sp.]|nr:adenylate/guanylate cyclase domain-containing protein [Treponema sp.]
MSKTQLRILIVPAAVIVFLFLLNLLAPLVNLDRRLYDGLLRLKPPIPENRGILFVDIDDNAIARVGTWPWGRDKIAEGLLAMREFGAARTVFDIEYTDKGPVGVDADLLETRIPDDFATEFASIDQNIADLVGALKARQIPLKDAGDYVKDLQKLTDESRSRLLARIGSIARDNDAYLGKAAKLFGKAFFTVNMLPYADKDVPPELRDLAVRDASLKRIKVAPDYPLVAADIRPAIAPILSRAAGAGFPNVVIDPDGVRRRISLVYGYGGAWFAQLGFSALLDWLGNPALDVRRNLIILRSAKLPSGEVRDLRIPLDAGSHLVINWPKQKFLESFRHLSFYELLYPRELERDLVHNLSAMDGAGYLAYDKATPGFLDLYRQAEELRQSALAEEKPELMDGYIAKRRDFFAAAAGFLGGPAEGAILADLDAAAKGKLDDRQRASLAGIRSDVVKTFADTKAISDRLDAQRARLATELRGAFCIVGQIGTSTTDIGVTPFENQYMNVGTHAAVVNTILQGRFLNELPWWMSFLVAAAAALVVALIIRAMQPIPTMLVGLGAVILIIVGGSAYFFLTGVYLPLSTPGLAVLLTFLAIAVMSFLRTARERTFIRSAFSRYLSADVISQIVSDPGRLKLGGDEKNLSAMFTDIRGFSTISEALEPPDLVQLLNFYLTEMSDIVLDLQGTIDKYEGDAIISFFGAPVEYEDHARRACLAAVHMKRAERTLNEKFLRDKISPSPLLTRIGINTGPMVVGNMGTQKKMDYTIMGNSVNLAARLEGVNKQYGTWILASGSTFEAAGPGFLARKLDRVRVVGISNPVRLYEIVEETSAATAEQTRGMEMFHEGLELFERKDWRKAKAAFREVLGVVPNDGPSETFLKRCAEYEAKPPAENWDGVFSLSMK